MSNLKENIISANLIARIESLIRVMKSSGTTNWDSNEKKWFAELLSPFSGNCAPENCHLIPSSNLPPFESGIILETLFQEFARDNEISQDQKKLKNKIKLLISLYTKLTSEDNELNERDKKQILELAIMLRHHMLDSVPSRVQINVEHLTNAYAW